ncbi:universal stress protein [Chelatococcus sambhunathii]|uniref:Universal stress protein n=1 Tax=Chelatococcus sambhunathii TaxID=363953 RepID=A0ABU1DG92_9HYPH|nr:universal stress protein [Chelatococcus sambhunathii]MDR4307148.1 universal stress protein [Chelatococcus sambhunathii]
MTTRPAASSPSYASVMVHFDLSPYAPQRGRLAVSLADTFGARLIGVAAEQIIAEAAGQAGYGADEETRRVSRNLEAAHQSYIDVIDSRNDAEWRARITAPDRYLVEQARSADIVVVGRRASYDQVDPWLGVSPGYVALECGRPVLVVPPETESLSPRAVVIAWKDTRESRRAVYDALPLLTRAGEVVVVSAGSAFRDESAEDVSAWLARHGANSRPLVSASGMSSVAEELLDIAADVGAGLLVSGAYGHSRTREWIFGGVTRDLLETASIPLLLSH